MPAAEWASGVHAQGLAALGLSPGAVQAAWPQASFQYATPHAAATAYLQGLTRGGARAEARRTAGAGRSELVAVAEFSAWLAALPPWWGRSAATAVPEDVVAYFECHWVTRHGRTYVGDSTDPVASASGVKGALLHLEHYFSALGRVGDWNPATLTGKPCRSHYVVNWRHGYKQEQLRAGVRPVAATPASDAQIGRMTQAPPSPPPHAPTARARRRPPASCVTDALRCRDDCLLYYLNEGGQRGGEVRRLPRSPA